MILNFIVKFVNYFVLAIFSVVPEVTLSSLPYIGSSVDSMMNTVMGYFNGLAVTVPYVRDLVIVFTLCIVPFEVIVMTMQFVWGNRNPIK